MKAMNVFISVLCGIMVLTLGSCSRERVEYRELGNSLLVIKTSPEGKKWGLISQGTDFNGNKIEYIPCEYDSIWYMGHPPYKIKGLYVAVKNGKKEVWSQNGRHLNGKDFLSAGYISFGDKYDGYWMTGKYLIRFVTAEGNVYLRDFPDLEEFGPYEHLYTGLNGFMYKENGKWGVVRYKHIKNENWDYIPFLPCIYDRIYEVIDGGSRSYWLLKKGDNWQAVKDDGTEVKLPLSYIKQLLAVPLISMAEMRIGEMPYYQRTGNDEVGLVSVFQTKRAVYKRR